MGSRTKKICIMLAVLALAGAFGCYGLFSSIRNNVVRSYAAEAAAQADAAYEQQIKALTASTTEIGSDILALSDSIIDTNGTVPFIEYVESLAQAAGASLTIDSVNVANTNTKNAKVENLQLTLTSQGSWTGVYTFLKLLEQLPYKTSVQSASFSAGTFDQESLDKKAKVAREVSVWRGSFIIHVLKRK